MKSEDLCVINSNIWAVGGLISSNLNFVTTVGCFAVALGYGLAALVITHHKRV